MKISVIGGGNMGGAIASGLASSNILKASDITVVDLSERTLKQLKTINPEINIAHADYASVSNSNIVILAVKPWLIENVILKLNGILRSNQIIISIASGISLAQLQSWLPDKTPIFRVMPNTAIAVKESLSFITSVNASKEQSVTIGNVFHELGKTMFIDEKLFPAVTALSSCGIAFAFRYIRAAIEGGVEMGIYPNQGRDILIQTLRGAIELLEINNSHPETEIDKVTTPGGNTIKGLNEMEHSGFTSSVIKGLLASYNSMF